MSGLLAYVRRTIVPERGSRFGPLPALMLVLTLVTGFVDAYSYLALGHVFVANMTGNVVFSAFAIAGTSGFSPVGMAAVLLAFVVGAFGGGLVVRRHQGHRGRMLFAAVGLETVPVCAAYLVAQSGPPPARDGVHYVLIALLGLGMGVQNEAARVLAVPDLTTTVLTMTITGVIADGRAAGGPGGRAGRRLLSVAALLLGAWAGASAVRHGDAPAALRCAFALLMLVALVAACTYRSHEVWTRARE